MTEFDCRGCRVGSGGAEAGKSSAGIFPRDGEAGGQQSHDGPETEKDRRGSSLRNDLGASHSASRRLVMTFSAGAIVSALAVLTGVTLFYSGGALRGAIASLQHGVRRPSAPSTLGVPVSALARRSTEEIQNLIDQSVDGAIIEIAPGIYEGGLVLGTRGVLLRSRDGASTTIIDGRTAIGPVVAVRGDPAASTHAIELRGFTIRGGHGLDGVGILVDHTDPIIADCVIEANGDGGLRFVDSRAIVDGCLIRNNATTMLGGGAQIANGTLTFVNCVFHGNAARMGGGAIASQGGAPIILASRFEGNRSISGAWGGAMFIDGGELAVFDTEFVRNGSSEEGGAIYLRGGTARIERCQFEANASRTAWSIMGHGAAVRVRSTRFCGPLEWNVRATTIDERDNDFNLGCVRDCNGNGVPDEIEIRDGSVNDCDESGIPDPCKIDCDGDGIPDVCAIAMGIARDGNENGIPDACEEAMGLLSPFSSNDLVTPTHTRARSVNGTPAWAEVLRR